MDIDTMAMENQGSNSNNEPIGDESINIDGESRSIDDGVQNGG